MSYRIALGNVRYPRNAEESIELATAAITQAAAAGAELLCFPECMVPGYRSSDTRAARPNAAAPNAEFLARAWSRISEQAARAKVGVILGTERITGTAPTTDDNRAPKPLISALVIRPDGTHAGFQDKVQLDPSEEATYRAGSERHIFQIGALTFGISICHEGWRYPETVRWAARRGAQVVFHPQFHPAAAGAFRPDAYADPRNSFHEKAVLCRAAENTCYFATVNHADIGSPTTSAVANPDGTLLCCQPYGQEGLLIADLNLRAATGLLAKRYRPLD